MGARGQGARRILAHLRPRRCYNVRRAYIIAKFSAGIDASVRHSFGSIFRSTNNLSLDWLSGPIYYVLTCCLSQAPPRQVPAKCTKTGRNFRLFAQRNIPVIIDRKIFKVCAERQYLFQTERDIIINVIKIDCK